jgi:hypothetical protein
MNTRPANAPITPRATAYVGEGELIGFLAEAAREGEHPARRVPLVAGPIMVSNGICGLVTGW